VNLLFLELVWDSKNVSLELRPQHKIRIGRTKTNDIVMDAKSVSSEHMEVEWTGTHVVLRDLSSKFGTFIEEESEGFKERVFTPLETRLHLRLGKSKLELSWRIEDLAPLEKTEVVEGSTRASPKTRTRAEAPLKLESERPSPAGKSSEPVAPSPAANAQKVASLQHSHRALFIFSAYLTALSFVLFAWPRLLSPLWYLDPFLLGQGAGFDLIFLYRNWLSENPHILLGVLALPFAADYLARRQRWSFALPAWSLSRLSQAVSYVALVASLLMPLIFACAKGYFPLSTWDALGRFHSDYRSGMLQKSASEDWADYADTLKGSSFVFVQFLQFRSEKVRTECLRAGVEDWEKRKLCVALFFAASVETAAEVQPAFLFEMATRVSLLAAIDGIMRVVQEEGRNSESLELYFETLASMGMTAEKEELTTLISDTNLSAEKLVSGLLLLRRQLDERLSARQLQKDVPAMMRLQSINLLNLGF
jgi:hypothetical protein